MTIRQTSPSKARSIAGVARSRLQSLVMLALLLPVLLVSAQWAPAATYVVTNTSDTTNISNPNYLGSLRAAIVQANDTLTTADTITFNLSSGSQQIFLSDALPPISSPLVIDGTTQPGYSGTPLIQVLANPGTNASFTSGFEIQADDSTIKGLLIGGFFMGILITGSTNQVQGCYIGALASGIPGNNYGVVVAGSNNTIGGLTAGARNVISGNTDVDGDGGIGVYVDGYFKEGTANFVRGNYIGTNAEGTAALPNTLYGILILGGPDSNNNQMGSQNIIGGALTSARNVISGNGLTGAAVRGTGIELLGSSKNLIQGNYIGTNAAGTAAIPNTGDGVVLSGGLDTNTVGGTTSGTGNVISGNGRNGIYTDLVFGDLVQGNIIGADATGNAPLPNAGNGVHLDNGSLEVTIGGITAGAANIIAFNTGSGVLVTSGAEGVSDADSIRGNAIFNNGALGINLQGGAENSKGVTANDNGDDDDGPNYLQNYPVLGTITLTSTGIVISATLNGTPDTSFVIDYFRSATVDGSGYGEGEIYMGSKAVTTNSTGNVTFSAAFTGSFNGQFITATATDVSGTTTTSRNSTSEFSAARQVLPLLTLAIPSTSFNEAAGSHAAQGTITRSGDTSADLIVTLSSSDTSEASVPAAVTIPAGQSSVKFFVDAVDDTSIDGPQTAIIRATATGFQSAVDTVTVTDSETKLFLSIRPGTISETGSATGTVTRNGPTTAAVTVTLTNGNSRKIQIPASVVIPAGQANVTFAVKSIDNSAPDGPQRVAIAARAPGYATASAGLTILDDEARLTLTISPGSFNETAGPNAAQAIISRNTPTTAPLTLKLISGNTRKVTVPSIVTIPAGSTFTSFAVAAVDNTVADGPMRVPISARATNYPTTSAGITVLDNEARLTLTINRTSFSETAGAGAATITVRRNTPVTPSTPGLNVVLSSSDLTEATVPRSVTIPLGAASVTFPVNAVDDTVADGPRLATITASASSQGYAPGTITVTVLDNEGG